MIKNIIFDLGRVLLEFEPESFLWQHYSSHPRAQDMVASIMEHVFNSREWIELDRGIISLSVATQKMIQRCPQYKDEIEYCMQNWHKMLIPIAGSVTILKEIKSNKYTIYILSNFQKNAFEYVEKKYDFFSLFDDKIISYTMGMIKPEAAIFKETIARFSINPEESLFIDDMLPNVKAAAEAGFQTIHFKNPLQLKDELNSKFTQIL